jgi:hypothetical protein
MNINIVVNTGIVIDVIANIIMKIIPGNAMIITLL